MRILITEDDFTSRRLLQLILAPYGQCDIAVNGREAVAAFRLAWDENSPYDLVCLDIMMPEMDGQDVLRAIRELEMQQGVDLLHGVKVIMITALGDKDSIKQAFEEQCEAYLIKPIDKEKLILELKKLGLIE